MATKVVASCCCTSSGMSPPGSITDSFFSRSGHPMYIISILMSGNLLSASCFSRTAPCFSVSEVPGNTTRSVVPASAIAARVMEPTKRSAIARSIVRLICLPPFPDLWVNKLGNSALCQSAPVKSASLL